ncbi:uncharacterized protein PAE49_023701 [Odontesthes bonariensis]
MEVPRRAGDGLGAGRPTSQRSKEHNKSSGQDEPGGDGPPQASARFSGPSGEHESPLRKVVDNLLQLATGITDLGGRIDVIASQLAALPRSPSSPPPPAPAPETTMSPMFVPWEPYIPTPARYSGHLGTYSQFLHQCSLVFHQQPVRRNLKLLQSSRLVVSSPVLC